MKNALPRRFIKFGFHLLYHELAFTYDALAWLVSLGQWQAWGRTALDRVRGPRVLEVGHGPGHLLIALARAGEAVTVEPRRVRIDALRIVAWQSPDLTLDVECGKGTYIRSLAHDLGQRLGCGAHLTALCRTRIGPYHLGDAASLEELQTRREERGLA